MTLDLRYTINSADEMVIIFGHGCTEFELALDDGALRTLVRLGAEALAKMDTCVKSGHLVPCDYTFHDDKQLVADLATLNEKLSRYILRYLAADALQAEPLGADDEQELAEVMTGLARRVRERANRRAVSDVPPACEDDATPRRRSDGRPSER